MIKTGLCLAMALSASAPLWAGTPADLISMDGFESGNTLGWDLTVPALTTPEVLRMSHLSLRDPHLTTNIPGLPGLGCIDFTDDDFPLGLAPSFNHQLATAMTTDGDLDGYLDLSRLLAFRPFLFDVSVSSVDDGLGNCPVPPAPMICDWRKPPVPFTVSFLPQFSGTCLEPLAGTTSGYSPGVPTTSAPCFATSARTGTIDFGGVPLTLLDVQTAAQYILAPPLPITFVSSGLQRGFLTEAAANAALIPADVPVIGGRPIATLLPGGSGNCSAGDDRDTYLGESGWWFYFEFDGGIVGFIGQ